MKEKGGKFDDNIRNIGKWIVSTYPKKAGIIYCITTKQSQVNNNILYYDLYQEIARKLEQ